jgi:hypothetical protein
MFEYPIYKQIYVRFLLIRIQNRMTIVTFLLSFCFRNNFVSYVKNYFVILRRNSKWLVIQL